MVGVAALLLTALVALFALRLGRGPRHPVVEVQQVAVPSYFPPGGEWARLAEGVPTVAMGIVNPSSGPGTALWPELAASAATARAAGVRMLGYVDTAYGERPVAAVQADVDRYYEWYGVDGVFFDQVSSECDQAGYYLALAGDVAERGGFTVLNPGANPDRCYADVADVLVVFEGTADDYADWKPASWQWKHPPQRFWHLVYGTDAARQAEVVDAAKHRNAGWLYVTPDALPNPWGRLPSNAQWRALLRLAGGDAASDS